MPDVSYYLQARQDLADAVSYYTRKRPGLERDFLEEARKCECQILQFPESGATIFGEMRRKLFSSYPYALVYIIEPDGDIRVIAVTHLKRKPFYWLGQE